MLIASSSRRLPTYSTTDSPKVVIRKTQRYGFGVFSREKIKTGELITSFDGTVYEGYYQDELPEDVRDHAIQFELHKVRDSKGLARLINHSCSPNCGVRGLFDIVAMRDIERNTEITWDYDTSDNAEWVMHCQCGEAECRKVLRGFRYLPQTFRQRYRGYISDWLEDTIGIPPLPLPNVSF